MSAQDAPFALVNSRLAAARSVPDREERPGKCQGCGSLITWVYIEPDESHISGRYVPVEVVHIYVSARPPQLDRNGRPSEPFSKLMVVLGGESRLRGMFSFESASGLVGRELHYATCKAVPYVER